MQTPTRVLLLTSAVLVLLAAACGRPAPLPDAKARLGHQRLMLSEGYSLLYDEASKIDRVELVLYVKTDSKAFDALVEKVSDFGGQVRKDLERIAADYPGVRIDLHPLPEMEMRKRHAIGQDRLIQFAPVSGHGGPEYERTMLISISNALNHESHLCHVMADEEPDAGLKQFLLQSERRYDELSELTMGLLNREYFKFDANPRKAP